MKNYSLITSLLLLLLYYYYYIIIIVVIIIRYLECQLFICNVFLYQHLRSLGVEVRLRNGANYSTEDVDWADVIFSAGGDGTFLFASSKVFSPDKLVVGFNTDKITSEGFLCFNSGGRYPSLQDSLQAVFQRDVPLYRRARIRVEKNGQILPVRALNEVFVGEVNPSQ